MAVRFRWRDVVCRWDCLKKFIMKNTLLIWHKTLPLIATSDGVLEVMPKGSAAEKEKQLQAMAIRVQTVDDLNRLVNLTDDDELPDDVALLVIKRAS
jgi:hypothetical protein